MNISVETVGFGRHRITNINKGFWDGSKWTSDPRKARLYYRFQEAAVDLKKIQDAGQIRKRYQANVIVDVLGDKPMDLAAYLSKAAKLSLTEAGENIVQMEIDWDTLEEKNDTHS